MLTFSAFCFVIPEEKIAALGLGFLACVDYDNISVSIPILPRLARPKGKRTPSPMILPSVLGLEMLSRKTGIAIALPDTIREKSFQWNFLNTSIVSSSPSAAFTTASEHDGWRCGGVETWCYQSSRVLISLTLC